jgi:hypothetical protein
MPARKTVTHIDGKAYITCTTCNRARELTPDNFSPDTTTALGVHYQCRECRNKLSMDAYHALKKEVKDERNKRKTVASRKRRLAVLQHYCDGDLRCACCGEREVKFLALDHINGGGNQHRKAIGLKNRAGHNFYLWVIRNNFPAWFQVLCHNCNMAKGLYGNYPHQALAA